MLARERKASQIDQSGAGAPEWREGERSEPDRNGGAPATGEAGRPARAAGDALKPAAEPFSPSDLEVLEKPKRRRFTTAYKLRVLAEADACSRRGEIGALLRREGLYSSLLDKWRKQRAAGAIESSGKKQSRRQKAEEAKTRRILKLERENRRLSRELHKAEIVIDIQKKVADLLGLPLKSPYDEGSD